MTHLTRSILILPIVLAFCVQAGCTRHEVDVKPVEIKPIHITIDVNVKVDRALDDFFSDIDDAIESKQ
ncbi:MAG: hypothetical protein V2I35_01510 [Desulfocapsaceae bacterium]|jgi:hypothetical protein|nr:hypothetical protein [Desulfocapsaceae bacterium]